MSDNGLAELHALLRQALDLEPAERAAWLARLHAEQPAQAREVEALLAAEPALDAARFLSDDLLAGAAVANATAGLAGQRLGAWTLERPLGHGGMGTVWLARRSDGRYEATAAVKLLNLALVDPIGSARFLREGNMLARLDHPYIARLLDAGVTAGGQPYLILEHVEGERIDRWCAAHQLRPEARLKVFLEVLDAVAHAHANLIVHRDLKPSNILVTADSGVKLLDFGIARLLEDERGAEASTLTVVGGNALTPEYAAPEQLVGGAITTATDVYALGVLLYVLLAGRHPTGEGSRTAAEHLNAILENEPPRLSTVVTGAEERDSTVERLRRIYAGDLDNIVGKALKKRAEERYATVGAFADDLRRYLANEPVSARADSWSYRAGKFVRRNRRVVALVGVAIFALLAGLAGTITQAVRAERAARSAEAERDFALRQLSRVEAINDLNNFLLHEAAPAGGPITVATLLAQAETLVLRGRRSDPNRADLLINLGQSYNDREETGKARRLLEQAHALSRQGDEVAVRARAACTLAGALTSDVDLDRAAELVRQALDALPEGALFVRDRLECFEAGALVASARGDVAAAVGWLENAEQLHREHGLPPSRDYFFRQSTAALIYQRAGRFADATRAFERAHQSMIELGRDRTRSAATLYNNRALLLGIAGQTRAAESLFRRALEIERGDSSLSAVSPILLGSYARTLAELERFAEAAPFAELAFDGARRGGDEYMLGVALRIRASIYTGLGELERAERTLGELVRPLQDYPPEHPVFMHLLFVRAQLALRQGNLAGAATAADSAVRLSQVLPGANQFQARMLIRRAEVSLARRRFDQVESDARLALDATARLLGPDALSADNGRAYFLLGQALREQGRAAEAAKAFAEAARQFQPTLGEDHPRTLEALRLAPRN